MGFIKSSLLIQDDNCLYLQGEEEPGPEADERGEDTCLSPGATKGRGMGEQKKV
jgi:hypothetical protein